MIWLEGVCGVPMAWRRKERTITKRVKDVVMINKAGARVRMVNRKTIWRVVATCSGLSAGLTEMLMPGIGDCAKSWKLQPQKRNSKNNPKIFLRILFILMNLEVETNDQGIHQQWHQAFYLHPQLSVIQMVSKLFWNRIWFWHPQNYIQLFIWLA